MKKKITLYIVYGNHPEGLKAINDLAQIIKESTVDSGIFQSIQYSKNIVENEVNILIEEFSNRKFCNEIINIKNQYPKTKIYLIITEIPINGSFNNFENKKNKLFGSDKNKLLNYGNFYLSYLITHKIRMIRNKFINNIIKIIEIILKPNNKYYIKYKILILKIILIVNNKLNLSKDLSEITNKYFYIRYHNTKLLINKRLFNKIFIINESSKNITEQAFSCEAIEFPYKIVIGNNRIKSNMMLFSGSPTKHRERIITEIKDKYIEIKCNFKFDDAIRNLYSDSSYYSLHIARYESNTEYSSPTRTLQALKNGMLPISYKRCLESNMEKELGIESLNNIISDINGTDCNKILIDYYIKKMRSLEEISQGYNKNSLKFIIKYFQ